MGDFLLEVATGVRPVMVFGAQLVLVVAILYFVRFVLYRLFRNFCELFDLLLICFSAYGGGYIAAVALKTFTSMSKVAANVTGYLVCCVLIILATRDYEYLWVAIAYRVVCALCFWVVFTPMIEKSQKFVDNFHYDPSNLAMKVLLYTASLVVFGYFCTVEAVHRRHMYMEIL